MSEGVYANMRPQLPSPPAPLPKGEGRKGGGDKNTDESTDTYDTIDWLIKNIPNNGKAGIYGISYPGFYTVCGMIDAHPALVAASPQAPVTDWFVGDDFHHNGCLFLPHCFNFMANFGRPRPEPVKKWGKPFEHGTPDGYQFFLEMGPLANADKKYFKGDIAFWNDTMKHGTYDEFWKSRNIRAHTKNIKPEVLTVGGWFDAENLFGALETYKATEGENPPKYNTLVMGPWSHGQWSRGDADKLGDIPFNSKTGVYFREKMELPFFEYHLKGKGEMKHPKAWVFETGTNHWRRYDAWPPRESKALSLYFHADEKLRFGETPDGKEGFDEYVSDPNKPVPYIDKVSIGMNPEYMLSDQRFASRRPDVLMYQTPALEKDLTLAGPVEADLYVSTTGTDSDWVVKLIDVYPDDYPDPQENPKGVRMGGYQQLIRGEPFRGKFRNGFDKPEPFEPGKVAHVKFTLPDVNHTFRPGHRLMIQVQSSWFPLADRNPQTFCDIYSAKPEDFKKATQRVYHQQGQASCVTVRVLP